MAAGLKRNRTERSKDTPDCKTCGICCVARAEQDVWVDLEENDLERIPKKYWKHVHFPSLLDWYPLGLFTKTLQIRSGKYKGVVVCKCELLQGSVGHKVSCAIYRSRPAVCREALQPGDKLCRELRAEFDEDAR